MLLNILILWPIGYDLIFFPTFKCTYIFVICDLRVKTKGEFPVGSEGDGQFVVLNLCYIFLVIIVTTTTSNCNSLLYVRNACFIGQIKTNYLELIS